MRHQWHRNLPLRLHSRYAVGVYHQRHAIVQAPFI